MAHHRFQCDSCGGLYNLTVGGARSGILRVYVSRGSSVSYRIMCAYQASGLGDKAFEFALSLAHQLHGELFVLSVFQPAEDARDSEPAALQRAAEQEFRPAFARLRSDAENLANPAYFDVSVGYPALHVLSEAGRLGIQHIVVAADQRQWSMGSAAQRIALLAECAVTLMR